MRDTDPDRTVRVQSAKRQAIDLNDDEYRHLKSNFIENVLKRGKLLFKTAHFTAEGLSSADLDLVILLNNACRDFFLFQNGQPPNEVDAREVFESVPPPCPGATKLPIGVFDQFGKLVGLIDVLRGYRTRADWYIGLMLLAPGFQGQGFGTEIHDEFVNYARREGARRLLLAVLSRQMSQPAGSGCVWATARSKIFHPGSLVSVSTG